MHYPLLSPIRFSLFFPVLSYKSTPGARHFNMQPREEFIKRHDGPSSETQILCKVIAHFSYKHAHTVHTLPSFPLFLSLACAICRCLQVSAMSGTSADGNRCYGHACPDSAKGSATRATLLCHSLCLWYCPCPWLPHSAALHV